jgi:hypothetical protein
MQLKQPNEDIFFLEKGSPPALFKAQCALSTRNEVIISTPAVTVRPDPIRSA